jgi:hypothetical protein
MLKRIPLRRPSPAMIVAMIALVGAFGGSAIADEAVQISKLIKGSKIKKRSIAGNRLKRDTLGGTEINESKLGKVPSAKNADAAASAQEARNATNAVNAANAANAANAENAANAANAVNADSVDGFSAARIFFTQVVGDGTTVQALNLGGLVIEASCDAGVGNELTAVAKTTVDNAQVDVGINSSTDQGFDDNDPDTPFGVGHTFFDNQGGDRQDEDDDLDVGDSLNLVDDERAAGDNLNGRIVYFRPDGGVVTGQYLAEEDSAQGNDCEFVGTAIATSG